MGARMELDVPGTGDVGGWLATPRGAPVGGLVVLQEVFGLNAHVRAVADRYADDGFLALAPALFDPASRGVELDYDASGLDAGRALAADVGFERAVAIVAAAAAWLRGQPGIAADGVGVVGFCWGGSLAYLANTRLGLPAVSYYGARTVPFLGEALRAPMLFHFGARDASIPAADIAAHRQAHPEASVHVYEDAGHAFNRDVDPAHHVPEAARLARARTLDFLRRALAPAAGR